MKKLMKMTLLFVIFAVLLIGCGKKDDTDKKNESTGSTTGSNEESKDETDDTNETSTPTGVGTGYQFEAPKKGETIAEIVVKDYGTISVKFFKDDTPKAVENFITHAKEGYYDGLTFHRIIKDFMIQGGDPTGTGAGGESIWGSEFEDEFTDKLSPYRGALCMANAGPNTNGSQFFIVQAPSISQDILEQMISQYGLDFTEEQKANYFNIGGTPWLYQQHTVFGQMYEGFDVLDAIAAVEADAQTGTPANEVFIEKITIKEYK